jgi:two-component system phosphate regulon sensor histidine kinase PhoR
MHHQIHRERHQVFLHMVDDDPIETHEPHVGKIGYYGFTVSERTLVRQYFPRLLEKHLEPFTSRSGQKPVAAIFDESSRQLSVSRAAPAAPFTVQESLEGLLPGWTVRAGFPTGALRNFDRSQFVGGIGVVVGIAGLLLVTIGFLGMTAAREMELSRAKTEFVASVSHELKTPLAVIRGFVETLHMNRVRDASQREDYFRIIDSEILRLTGMIERILEISKIEVGLKRYEPETVDVWILIEETLAGFSHELERKRFSVESHIEAPLPPIHVDPQAFSQALLNLLSNAVKYSEDDRRIKLKAARSNSRLEVSVTDSGIGIPRQEMGRIFDKFYRADDTSSKTAGAGLGLALVKHFARAHGGDVTVTSVPGQGSTFVIQLPLPT